MAWKAEHRALVIEIYSKFGYFLIAMLHFLFILLRLPEPNIFEAPSL